MNSLGENKAQTRAHFLLLWGGMTVLYALWRLPGFTALPPFTDEVVFLHWTQLLDQDFFGNTFVAYSGAGKQSLAFWLGALFYPLFDEPLIGLRLFSLLCGLIGLWGVMLLARLFAPEHPRAAPWLTGLAFIATPFFVWHERHFIQEPLIGVFNVWSFLLAWLYLRDGHRLQALLYGVVLGLGLITKTYCLYFLGYPLLLILDNRLRERRWATRRQWLGLAAAVGLALMIYVAVNAYPRLVMTDVRALKFSDYMNFSVASMVGQMRANLPRLIEIFFKNFGLPTLLFFVAYVVVAWRRRLQGLASFPLLVGGAIIIPLLFSKYIFSRYISVAAPYIVLGAALFIVKGYEWLRAARGRSWAVAGAVVGLVAMIGPLLPAGWGMLRDPINANLDHMDRWQYITGWPSGYGLRESVEYLRGEIGDEQVDVFFNHNLRGIPFNGYEYYFDGEDNVRLHAIFWERQLPVLDFVARNYVVNGYRSNTHNERELLRPEQMRRVFYVGNISLMNMKNFLALNGEPLKYSLFYRPEKKSALAVFELRVPSIGSAPPAINPENQPDPPTMPPPAAGD